MRARDIKPALTATLDPSSTAVISNEGGVYILQGGKAFFLSPRAAANLVELYGVAKTNDTEREAAA